MIKNCVLSYLWPKAIGGTRWITGKGNPETVHEEEMDFLDEGVVRHAKSAPPRMACDPAPAQDLRLA